MTRLAAVGLAVVLLLASVAATPATGQSRSNMGVQTPDRFDQTTFRVTVYANGSATWTIEHQTPLRNESEQQRFEDFAAEFESSQTELYSDFVEQARILTRYGTNATGRQMSASDFERSASVNPIQSTGVVRMSFQWSNFATFTDDSVVVSDVFEGGFYIGPSQSFVVERGPTLQFTDVQPQPSSQSNPDSLADSVSVTWNGERTFNDRRPYVELRPRPVTDSNTPSGADTGTPGPSPGGSGDGDASWMLPVAVLVIALGLVGAAVWRTRLSPGPRGPGDGGAPAATESVPAESTGDTDVEADADSAVSDEELLTDSDRVRKLLEDNGGRMKQVDIVDSTDWSKSKVSMLLSDMEDDGEITKLRVGRENIISLAGHEPDAAGSPFDEE